MGSKRSETSHLLDPMFLTEFFGNLRVHRESSWRMHANPCQPDLFSISDPVQLSAVGFSACLRNPLPLLLWRRGLGRGGRFLTRALTIAAFGLPLLLLLLPACKPKEIQTLLGPSQSSELRARRRSCPACRSKKTSRPHYRRCFLGAAFHP